MTRESGVRRTSQPLTARVAFPSFTEVTAVAGDDVDMTRPARITPDVSMAMTRRRKPIEIAPRFAARRELARSVEPTVRIRVRGAYDEMRGRAGRSYRDEVGQFRPTAFGDSPNGLDHFRTLIVGRCCEPT